MKGDFSRNTFDKKKHFTSVRMQQGRVQLDADWNEQMDIIDNRIRVGSEDFIGGSGAPSGAPGYKITATTTDLTISKGRFYVQGILIENENDISYSSQTLPDKYLLASQKTDGLYLAYLDVWQQGVSAAIDPSIEEPALNGADTTMRVKNVAQVKLLALANSQYTGTALKCSTVIDKDTKNKVVWQTAIAASTGKLSAKVSANANLKNQLYRVEIHEGGDQNKATFKWSRDNGALVGKIKNINGNIITIANSISTTLNFKSGQWVELSTEKRILQHKPGVFVQLLNVNDTSLTIINWPTGTIANEFINGTIRQWDNVKTFILKSNNFTVINITNFKINNGNITVNLTSLSDAKKFKVNEFVELRNDKNKTGVFARLKMIKNTTLTLESSYLFPETHKPKYIRPAGQAATVVNDIDQFIDLENGLQIKFESGIYKTGDYWLIPSREINNSIEWPKKDSQFIAQLPEGIVHYYAQLALVRKTGATWEIAGDCRNIISALGNKAYQSEPGDNEDSVFVDKNGNVTVKKQLKIEGSVELKKGVTITGETKTTALTASGKTTTNSLQVDGSMILKSSLSATGNVSAGSITTTGKTQTDSLQVDGTTELKKGVTVTGETKTNSLQVDGSTILKSSLSATGNVSAGSITTTGKTQTNSLQVDGTTELKKGVTVTGETKTTSLTASGKTTTSSLQVDGSTILKSNLSATGNVSAGSITTTGKTQTGSLQVDGTTELKKGVTVTGETKTTSLTASGKTTTGSLQVDGSTILKSSLSATGNVSAGSITTTGKTQTGSLQVDSSAELKKGVTITGETKTDSLQIGTSSLINTIITSLSAQRDNAIPTEKAVQDKFSLTPGVNKIPKASNSARIDLKWSLSTTQIRLLSKWLGNRWMSAAPMIQKRGHLTSGVVNGKLYAIGGYDHAFLNLVEEYDPIKDSWKSLTTPMPTKRARITASVVNNKIYVFGGSNGSVLNIVEEYNPITGKWKSSTKTDATTGKPELAPMPTARADATSAVVGGKIYVIGGSLGIMSNQTDRIEEYDPIMNTWRSSNTAKNASGIKALERMPTARYLLVSGVVNNKIYVIGGWIGSGLNTIEEYDPITNIWRSSDTSKNASGVKALKPMPTARLVTSSAVAGNKIYVVGGWNSSFFDIVEEYDPTNNIWKTKSSMPTAREYETSSTVNGEIYIIGGSNASGSYLNTVEVYLPYFNLGEE